MTTLRGDLQYQAPKWESPGIPEQADWSTDDHDFESVARSLFVIVVTGGDLVIQAYEKTTTDTMTLPGGYVGIVPFGVTRIVRSGTTMGGDVFGIL